MMSFSEEGARVSKGRRYRIAGQPHLGSCALTWGLTDRPDVEYSVLPPGAAMEQLVAGALDAALVPAGELAQAREIVVLPSGCLATEGTALTARVFARVRPSRIETLWVDNESRTAAMLAKVLWALSFDVAVRTVPFDSTVQEVPEDAEGILLLGDDAVSNPPLGFDWQLDAGALWWELTGLPIVLGVWTAAEGGDCEALDRLLSDARRRAAVQLERIARRHALEHNWPEELAVRYLTRQIRLDFTRAQRDGLEEFLCLAAECGAIDQAPPVRYYRPR